MPDHQQPPFIRKAAEAITRLEEDFAALPADRRDRINQAALTDASETTGLRPDIGDEVIAADNGLAGRLTRLVRTEEPFVFEELAGPGSLGIVNLRVGFDTIVMGTVDTPFGSVEIAHDRLLRASLVDQKRLELAGLDVAPVMLTFATPDGTCEESIVIPKQKVPEFWIELPDLIRLVSRIGKTGNRDSIPNGTTAWRYVQGNGTELFEPVSQEFMKNPPVPYAFRSERVLITGSGSSLRRFSESLVNGTLDTHDMPAPVLEQLKNSQRVQSNSHVQSFWASFFSQPQFADLPGSVPSTLIDTGEIRSNDYIGGSTLKGPWLGDRLREICETWGVRYLRIGLKTT